MKILSDRCIEIFIDKATLQAINIIDGFRTGRICLTIRFHYSWLHYFHYSELNARSPYLREA